MLRTITVLAAVCCLLPGPAHAQETLIEIPVWPEAAPDEVVDVGPELVQPLRAGEIPPTTRITNVTRPALRVFRAPPKQANGTAVVVCPGGGLNILAWDKEGTEVAEWLNSVGVTAFVLKYRVPVRQKEQRWKQALQDCQRAMSLIRHHSADYDIAPDRIGMLGFSAGGFLAAMTATSFDQRTYEPIDATDAVSSRPDFVVLVYPAYLIDNNTNQLLPHVTVTGNTPPVFFAHAWDDRVKPENSIAFFEALRQKNVRAELHVFDAGGHGFGLRRTTSPATHWPELCERWLERNQWLGGWSEQNIARLPAGETPVRLFNGTTLEGWRPQTRKHFTVRDGLIVAQNHVADAPAASTYLLTNGEYRNFRLIFEARLATSEMHSGIAFWGEPVLREGDPNSYRGHLVMFPSNYGIWDLYRRNSLYRDKDGAARRAGVQHGWNRMEILAIGSRIRHVVNGVVVADWTDPQPDLCHRGPIGLQLHSNKVPQEVHFRGLILTEDPRDRLVTISK